MSVMIGFFMIKLVQHFLVGEPIGQLCVCVFGTDDSWQANWEIVEAWQKIVE